MRLIDADAFRESLYDACGKVRGREVPNWILYDAIDNAPTIEAEPVRHGVWVSRFAKHWKGKDECGECGFHEKDHRDLSHYKYCPNCGAKMDGGADDATN